MHSYDSWPALDAPNLLHHHNNIVVVAFIVMMASMNTYIDNGDDFMHIIYMY